MFEGFGGWIWLAHNVRGPDGKVAATSQDMPRVVVASAVSFGMKWIAIKSGESFLNEANGNQCDPKLMPLWRKACDDAGVKLFTWHYGHDPRVLHYQNGQGHNFMCEVDQIKQLRDMGVDGHILDMEAPWEFVGSAASATTYCDALDSELGDFPIAHAPHPCRLWHPGYPYAIFADRLLAHQGVTMPQAYWTETYDGQWSSMRDRFMKKHWEDWDFVKHPVYWIGCDYGKEQSPASPGHFNPDDLSEFLSLALPNCSLYSLDCQDHRAHDLLVQHAKEAACLQVMVPHNVPGIEPSSNG